MIIYKVTNKITGRVYIGQTIGSIRQRWVHHCGKWSSCLYLKHSIQKHGKENFTIEEIYKANSLEELNKKEEELIILYDSRNIEKGYNIRHGGNNSKPSEESKKKMSISSTGKKHSEETKQKMSELRKNMTAETRLKMSESRKGKVQSIETKEKRIRTMRLNKNIKELAIGEELNKGNE